MSVVIAVITVIGWGLAMLLSIIGLICDNDDIRGLADVIMWAVAGLVVGCTTSCVVTKYEETHPDVDEPKCVVYNGTKYCGEQRIETSTQIIKIDKDGNIDVTIK